MIANVFGIRPLNTLAKQSVMFATFLCNKSCTISSSCTTHNYVWVHILIYKTFHNPSNYYRSTSVTCEVRSCITQGVSGNGSQYCDLSLAKILMASVQICYTEFCLRTKVYYDYTLLSVFVLSVCQGVWVPIWCD